MSAGREGRTTGLSDFGDKTVRVTGRVTEPLIVGMEILRAMDTEEIEDLMVICGDGDPKGNIRNCKGVLLENIIRMADVINAAEDRGKDLAGDHASQSCDSHRRECRVQ